MNSNLPRAARVIHAALRSVPPDQATAAARALDSARLLTDPERSFGVLLHRAPDGDWSRTPRRSDEPGRRAAPAQPEGPAAPEPEPVRPVTELERQALAWDDSCARARQVARAVERQMHGHPGPHGIRVDGDRVRVLLRVDDPAQWARWRAYLGLTGADERSRPHTVTAQGERDGVPVTVVARGSGTAPPSRAGGPERRPFRLDGTRFDLALPQRDTNGDLWYFQGCRTPDGMPLLSLDGRPERCTLAQVQAQLGPLSPVRPSGRP
ncbi:BN159_2729 family protein [Streptomyces griseoruber]|uniref:BN159_2729 family protein n=1 Tax=Streptomyces griseoruber TaxID=1943 RepID=UPI0037B95AE5